MNMKKEVPRLLFYMVKMPFKQLPISMKDEVKDPFVIGQ